MWRRLPGLGTWTGRLLLVAAIFGFGAIALLVLTVPSTGWPLWENQGVSSRMAIAEVIIGVLGLGAAVLAIAAGVAEIHQVFPKQALLFRVLMSKQAELPPEADELVGIVLQVTAGPTMIDRWKVDGALIGAEFSFSLFYQTEVSRSTTDWTATMLPESEAVSLDGQGDDLFPNESRPSPSVLVPPDSTMTLEVTWWTDRRGPETFERPVKWDESKAVLHQAPDGPYYWYELAFD